MRGRRTALGRALVPVLVIALASVATGCDFGDGPDREPAAAPTLMADDGDATRPPELEGRVAVELGTAVAVFGLGCQPQSARQRCSAAGEKTYTLTGESLPATVTAAWMQLDTGGGRWVVHLRLGAGDRKSAERTAQRARDRGGLVVVMDAATGNVLLAVSPNDVDRGRIAREDLHRLTAESIVRSFVDVPEPG